MRFYITISAIFAILVLTGCKSLRTQTPDNIYWVYGHSFPFTAPIKQTNVETNFFGSVDLLIQNGLRDQLRGKETVSIEPIAMWTMFCYPAKTGLAVETEFHEDVTEMSGWVLAPDGSFQSSNNTNKTQSILVRQEAEACRATARLTMLLRIESAGVTNFTTAVLPCVWHEGTLESRGLKLKKWTQ